MAIEIVIPRGYASGRRLKRQREARRLVGIGNGVQLAPRAAAAWRRMHAAAKADGVAMIPVSGFRSVVRQAGIIRRKLRNGQTLEEILRVVAAPGYSQHHTGRAIDIGTPEDPSLEESFEKTETFRWLKRNAARFGFELSYPRGNPHRIVYEPWHWHYCSRPR